MKRILITGMSGTGTSTLIGDLAARGYTAIDLDCGAYSEWVEVEDDSQVPGTPVEPDRDWVWREDRVQQLLSTTEADVLFVSGCASNMGKFRPQFDYVVLLSASADVIVHRLRTRTTNRYGKHPDEEARVLELMKTVEPLLRRTADYEIDTNSSREEVVEKLFRFISR